MLDTEDETHEAAVLAGVLAHRDSDDDRTAVAVLSEDTHLRALAHGLGATVTSSYGVVARAAIDDKVSLAVGGQTDHPPDRQARAAHDRGATRAGGRRSGRLTLTRPENGEEEACRGG